MDVFRVTGNGPLRGKVAVSGAKNAALPLLAASLLSADPVRLRNVPDLSDIRFMIEIMRHIGAKVIQTEPVWLTSCASPTTWTPAGATPSTARRKSPMPPPRRRRSTAREQRGRRCVRAIDVIQGALRSRVVRA